MPDQPTGAEATGDTDRKLSARRGLEVSPLVDKLVREWGLDRDAAEKLFSPGFFTKDPEALADVARILGGYVPVLIYLANEEIHDHVEAAVDQWLSAAGLSIRTADEPVIGSWFRSMMASVQRGAKTPAAREALLTATHVADSHLVQAQDAYVTATLLQNVGPVLQALQPTKDAVVRAGALLIVKIDWVVQVHQLTAVQQAILDHQPKLVASPTEIISALQLQDPVIQESAIRSAGQRDGGGETAATASN